MQGVQINLHLGCPQFPAFAATTEAFVTPTKEVGVVLFSACRREHFTTLTALKRSLMYASVLTCVFLCRLGGWIVQHKAYSTHSQ